MKSLSNAVGAKTARACDSCVKRRARWYCAADDAFLCQVCDGSVHSANPLARRHERVRLKSASSVPPPGPATWHHGFARKARTPRGGGGRKKTNHRAIFHDLVPEISAEDQTENYEEEQLICQVPVLDHPMAESNTSFPLPVRMKFADIKDKDDDQDNAESCLNGFFPSDMELAEFAADVETLLGHGLETESFAMEELGLGYGSLSCGRSSSMVLKVEEEEEKEGTTTELSCDRGDVDVTPFELSFDYESHKTCAEEEEEEEDDKQNVINFNTGEGENETSGSGRSTIKDDEEEKGKGKKTKILMLRLDYESVISSWGGQGPPWTAGEPPELDLKNDSWPISMGEVNGGQYGSGICGVGLTMAMGDVGREARVSRYREKRRTRLFSKKIRYEVRKLNAEKRPRMKGRFVKRASLSALASSIPGAY
ncbi:PREDICTED: zinc finger protein CONSTANS-LIKE 16-like [Tarenaya hassleriana]|uniref:zinc finger protein CONSTANS-LIKE 16-like n=1 Tax=Tarenaya hassleriana TaxID=28532 RepID=UPI00053C2529|nr:PREDICTED: zinc finger protein CONSTANS-LIKE 16-like [Tarenaya hassleriana]